MVWPKAFNPLAVIAELKRKLSSLQDQFRASRGDNERLQRENEQLRQQREHWEQECQRLGRENQRLQQERQALKKKLELARRAAKRSAAPFSRNQRKQDPQKPGRKPGANHGTHHRKRVPKEVDEIIPVPVPEHCSDPNCGGALELEKTEPQYQQEIVRTTIWRRFDIPICRCTVCQRRVQGRHPLQTSDALGAAAVQLGPEALALGVQMNKGLGLPHADVAGVLRDGYHLEVNRSTICRAVERVARRGEATWHALRDAARQSLVNGIDETGWRVEGQLRWLWAVVSERVTFCDILPGRGFAQAASILGKDYGGWLTHDGWVVYYQFLKAAHQSCLSHLIIRCRKMGELATPSAARFPLRVKELLEQGLQLRDRYRENAISLHGLWTAAGRLEAKLDRLLACSYQDRANRRLAKHLRHERPYLFTFLYCPGLDATNNVVERMLRFLVVVRKNWGGNRTEKGARAQAVLTSILATAKQQRKPAMDLLIDLLCSPDKKKLMDIVPPNTRSHPDSSPSPPGAIPAATHAVPNANHTRLM